MKKSKASCVLNGTRYSIERTDRSVFITKTSESLYSTSTETLNLTLEEYSVIKELQELLG